MAIPKDAKNVANAHLFINYILRPEVAAALTNKVFYANPNAPRSSSSRRTSPRTRRSSSGRRPGAHDAARCRAAGDPARADAHLHQLQGWTLIRQRYRPGAGPPQGRPRPHGGQRTQ
jgi:hypothetical protein